ncbi:MAG: zf-HC2 domain-containing protein [Acidobacteria bacterium]|nr:zf-HC2 domain-containing protein [Acidobacteriota bacterium]
MSEPTPTVPAIEAAEARATSPCLDVAAYLDGELDDGEGARFEQHTKTCAPCATALAEQRRLLCVLDAAFGDAQKQLQLPSNFTEIVKARAQSDMSSVRNHSERKRAALLSAGLAALSFALLGWQAWDELFAPVRVAAGVAETMFDMATNALGEAAAGVALTLRVLGGQMLEEPGAGSVGTYIIFALAVALLFRLIVSYHRAPRLPE